jgi:predicted ATP-dependent serine protease
LQINTRRKAAHSYSSIAIRQSTKLPAFHAQISHLSNSIRRAKQRGKPLLVEGPPGLGKGTALQQLVSEEGQRRPAVYVQLSVVLRKRHGASSMVEDEAEDDFFTETETEVESVEERVALNVKRDAWKRAIEEALGVPEHICMYCDILHFSRFYLPLSHCNVRILSCERAVNT